MDYLQDLVNLIQVKNFLISSQEDMRIKLAVGQSSEIERKITQINKVLLEKSLALDLDQTALSDKKRFTYSTFESTELPEEVLANLPKLEKSETVQDTDEKSPLTKNKKAPKKILPVNSANASVEK